jgi:hypothetical protein
VQRFADELVVFAARFGQETTFDFHRVGHGAVQTAGLDVQIDLVLCIVRHHIHAFGFEFAQGVFSCVLAFSTPIFLPLIEAMPSNLMSFFSTILLGVL